MTGTLARVWLQAVLLAAVLCMASATHAMPGGDEAPEEAAEPAAFGDTAAGQAPAGVDLARPLAGGEWRLSYRFQGLWRSGNRIGSERVGVTEARLTQFPPFEEVPETRDTAVHTLGAAWAPHERVTLLVRVPILFIDEAADSLLAPGQVDSHSDGVGDMTFGALVPFMRKGDESTSVSLMIGAPTGSINKRGASGERSYPLQTGGGSWTMSPGLSYSGRYQDLSWGGQLAGIFSLNDNARDYQRGTEWRLTAWLGWSLGDFVSTSLRAEWNRWGNISGSDDEQSPPYASPAQDAVKQGGQRFDIGPGINLHLPRFARQRLALEAMFPVWQNLDGPQLGTSWVLNAAWRMSF